MATGKGSSNFNSFLKQRTIDDVVLRKVQQIALSGNIIKGCTIMKNGNKLFTEYYSGQVLKYGSNGQLISKLKVGNSYVFDITAIDDSNVAVSSGVTHTFASTAS